MRRSADRSRQRRDLGPGVEPPASSGRGPKSARAPHAGEAPLEGAPRSAKTIAASMLAPFVRHASRSGWTQEALADLCARHGVGLAALEDLTALVRQDGALALVEEICAHSRDDNLGLHLAVSAEPSWMSIPGLLGMSVASVREAIEVATSYFRRLNPCAPKDGVYVGDDGLLHMMIHAPDPRDPRWPRHLVEANVAVWITLLRRFTGVQVEAVQVSFQHPAPADLSEHVAFFGTTDLRFGAPFIELVLPASVLDLRHKSADPGLARYLRDQAEALIEERSGDDIASLVRKTLRDSLNRSAAVSLGSVARSLAMANRTLQRRLADNGVRFSALLEQVRCETAVELLKRSHADFDEVAERVGFSDARSLRRALKRQTGRTPSELRARDRPHVVRSGSRGRAGSATLGAGQRFGS
jgi:AraC-like DNA-binding protein